MIKIRHQTKYKFQVPNPLPVRQAGKSQINSKLKILHFKPYKFQAAVIVVIGLLGITWNLKYLYAQDQIAAVVNNDIITQKDLNDFVNFMRIQLSMEHKGADLENKIKSLKSDLLNKLIEDRIILQEAKRNNIKVDENRIKAKIEEIKKNYASNADFQYGLSKQGLTQADIELRIKEQLLMYAVIEAKVRSKVAITPTEVTEFYQNNKEEFKVPEQREFTSIIIVDKNLVTIILNSIKNGEDPGDLQKKYPMEVNRLSARQGEELREDIEKIIFGLKIDEISNPIESQKKYYIFKLENIIPPRQLILSEVQDKIHGFLFDKKMQEELTEWLEDLKKSSYVKIEQ